MRTKTRKALTRRVTVPSKNVVFVVSSHQVLEFQKNHVVFRKFLEQRLKHFFPGASIIFASKSSAPAKPGQVIVELSLLSPFLDTTLVEKMIREARRRPRTEVRSRGHIPGTVPGRVYSAPVGKSKKIIYSRMQARYSTQFNLYKLKRQKHFLSFLREVEDLARMRLEDFLEFLQTPRGIDLYLRYGEDVRLVSHRCCPYCRNEGAEDLFCSSSHPLNGFLPRQVSLYAQCGACGLVYFKQCFPKQQLRRVYDEYLNEFALHRMQDKIIHDIDGRHMFRRALERLAGTLPVNPSVADLGCGGGEFLGFATEELKGGAFYGLDYRIDEKQERLFDAAGIQKISGDLVEGLDRIGRRMDLITAWEVVEHLPMDGLLALLRKSIERLSPKGRLVFSTPDYENPICRLFDFWAACPIQHLFVFSESWLRRVVVECGGEIEIVFHGNRMLRDASWSRYCAETASTEADSANAEMFTKLLEDPASRENLLNNLESQDLGSEVVFIVKRRS